MQFFPPPAVLACHRSTVAPPTGCAKTYEPIAYHPIPYLFLANHFSIKVTGITRRISYHLFILTPHVISFIFYILHGPSLRSDILSTYILYPILVVFTSLLCYRTFHTISLHVLTSPVCGSPSESAAPPLA